MPDIQDDFPDAEWTGRPQDDPRLVAQTNEYRRAYIEKHRSADCWIDAPGTIDLYLQGRHRARVERGNALVLLLDGEGNTTDSFTFLRSECPFEVVERRLKIGRVLEVRDDSLEGGGEDHPFLRDIGERDARRFREQYPPAEEAQHYLRRAIEVYEFFGATVTPAGKAWRPKMDAAVAAIANSDRAAAHGLVQAALAPMNREAILDWQIAWIHCARAVEVLRRDLAREGSGE